IGIVPAFATAPALIVVGGLMMTGVMNVDFTDFSEGLPAFLTIIMMPLTSSIANGFAFGFISYVLMKVLTGKARQVNLVMWIVAAAFLVNLALRG
ncbi:MAG: NCS2 family permease, partial [Schwartzia sp.]|nr:NCS2 family permease [Schwartzia sp. (in: firmicutes)]